MALRRIDQLRALLPSKDAEYSFDALSRTETAALEAAFGDGFGNPGAVGHLPVSLPRDVRSGLVRHSFFVRETSEYDDQDNPFEFWEWDDDRPPPSESCPLNFELRRLSLYFANQLDRFCAHLIREEPSLASLDKEYLAEEAASRLYEKPWYEYHAVQHIEWIEVTPDWLKVGKDTRFQNLLISGFSGTLGRLVEQYYWRFRFEKAAITGVGARTGASIGGKAKARLHEAEHSRWQNAAGAIWSRRPDLGKGAVAKLVKKQLDVSQTAKHIARFIKRP